MSRFLDERKRKVEVLSALFSGGLGSYAGAVSSVSEKSAMGWLAQTISIPEQYLAAILVLAAIVWGLGIYINGRWWFSPFLRFTAMVVNLAVCSMAVVVGMGTSAGYTYSWVFILLLIGTVNAAQDCKRSFVEADIWTPY